MRLPGGAPRVSALRAIVPPLAALLVLLTLWELAVRLTGVPVYLLPPPSAIAGAMGGDASELALAASVTARAALYGFVLSTAFGTLSAVVLAASRVLERALYPYTVFLQTVPIVAIAPLLVLWFGAGIRAVTISAFIVSVFPVIAGGLAGMRSVEPPLRDLFRLYGASRLSTLAKLELPAALPSLVTGLRVAAGLAVIGAIVGEFVAGFSETGAGLGILILSSYRQLRTDLLFAAVLFASMLGLLLFGAVNLAGYLLLRRWHPSAR
jgi:NitT/TauT family transport system permease protein